MLRRFALSIALFTSLLAASPAHAEEDVFLKATLQGSNGYKLRLSGYEDRVYLEAIRPDGGAIYYGKGTTTRKRLVFDLGDNGRFDLAFQPEGKPEDRRLPRFCTGHATRRRGVFTGTATFTGDLDYTSASTDRVRGTVNTSDVRCRRPPRDFNPPDNVVEHTYRVIGLEANGPYYIPEFSIDRRRGSGHTTVSASTWERDGAVEVSRFVNLRVPKESFSFDLRKDTATVAPPAPFSGTAGYDGRADPPDIWTGDLAVQLPGASVALTGPSFEASLYRGVVGTITVGAKRALRALRRSLGL